MGQTTKFALPYPEPADPADVPTDMHELADAVELALAPATVTSLPGSPTDGQTILYRAGTNGPLWRLRYSQAMFTLDTYGWEFLGGAPLIHEVDATDTINSATYVNAATVGPRVTAPLQGLYVVDYGITGTPANVAAAVLLSSPVWNDGTPSDTDAVVIQAAAASAQNTAVSRKRQMTAPAAGADVRIKYRQGAAAANCNVQRRYLHLYPIRVK